MKPLTPKTRGAIVYGHNCGQSSRTIAKRLGCGKTTINDILKRLYETHSLIPKNKLAVHHFLIHQPNKNLKPLFKKMVKIVDFVPKSLQQLGQLIQNSLFLLLLYAGILRKLGLHLVYLVKNPQ